MPLLDPSGERAGTGRLPRAHTSFQRDVREEVLCGSKELLGLGRKALRGSLPRLGFSHGSTKSSERCFSVTAIDLLLLGGVCAHIYINIYLYTNTHVSTCTATWAGPGPLYGRGVSLVVRNLNNAGCWVLNNILFWNNFFGWGNCYLQPPKPVNWVYALGNWLSKYLEETTRSSTKRVSSCSPPDIQHLCSPCAA